MGNLPMNMTEETLKEMAGACGAVVAVNLYKKAVPGSQGKNLYECVPSVANFKQAK